MVLWLFLFVYTISMTMYCFMLSVLFSKANTAAITAGIGWFVLYMPYVLSQTTLTSKLIACVFSNAAMAHGCRIIMVRLILDSLYFNKKK